MTSNTFDLAMVKVKKELEMEGFGVLTEIDVAATLKRKLNQEILSYLILGAYNSQLAHHDLEIDSSIGLLLSWNVVVRQDDKDNVHVKFMGLNAVLDLVDPPQINTVAKEAGQRLWRVLDSFL